MTKNKLLGVNSCFETTGVSSSVQKKACSSGKQNVAEAMLEIILLQEQ